MATSQVRKMNERTGRQVAVINRQMKPQWHEVFEGNPRIARAPRRDTVNLINAGGVRPYIVCKGATHWQWRTWDIAPGEIYLTEAEKEFAAPHAGRILIEPNTKEAGSNKAWLWERWQQLVDRRGGDFMQVGLPGAPRLAGVEFVQTPSFRAACAVLAVSKAFVGAEGGLHHAAAAVGVPAVVLFSGFIAPAVTGYAKHRNLYKGAAGLGCGSRMACACCAAAMQAITVDEVESNLKDIL